MRRPSHLDNMCRLVALTCNLTTLDLTRQRKSCQILYAAPLPTNLLLFTICQSIESGGHAARKRLLLSGHDPYDSSQRVQTEFLLYFPADRR